MTETRVFLERPPDDEHERLVAAVVAEHPAADLGSWMRHAFRREPGADGRTLRALFEARLPTTDP